MLVLCALFAYVTYRSRIDVGRDVSTSAANLASAVAYDVDRNFEMIDVALQSAIQAWTDPNLQAMSLSSQHRVVFDVATKASATGLILVLDRNGVVLARSDDANPKPDNFGDRDYFRVHVASDLGMFVSKPFIGRVSGRWIVALSRRISNPDGSFGGVALAALPLSYLDKLYDGLNLGDGGTITLFRTDGTVVTRKPYVEADINQSFRATDGFARIRSLRIGSYEGPSPIDGSDRLISFHRVGNLPLIQVVEVSADQAYAAWWSKTLIVGGILGLLCLSSLSLLILLHAELARRAAVEATLARLVGIDGLTEVANRRRFDECLHYEWQRAVREGTQLSLLMIDADQFKRYNDAFGHLKGDEMLKKIARVAMMSVHRPGDLAARYGGEEFAMLLPCTDLSGAMAVAETIRTGVLGLAEPNPGTSNGVATVSIGYACLRPLPGQASDQLIRQADAALYLAKAHGRNCCRCETARPRLAA